MKKMILNYELKFQFLNLVNNMRIFTLHDDV